MLRAMTFPGTIKNLLRISAIALYGFVGATFADDFKSVIIGSGQTMDLPRIHGDQFMLIRNFTQEDGTTHGVVTVTKPPSNTISVNVLAAAILSMPTAEVINSAVIAGPADVSVTCGDTTGSCFISFKKDSN